MARRKDEEENYWPGFVDALSTIVMVVTFLLIILAVVIFMASQNIAKVVVESLVTEDQKGQSTEAPITSDEFNENATTMEQREFQNGTISTPEEPTEFSETEGERTPELGNPLMQENPPETNTDLAIRSRDVEDELRLVIAPEEKAEEEQPGVRVSSSNSFLTLEFTRGALVIDQDSSGQIGTFLNENSLDREGKYEIRGFALSSSNSVSESRRISFYRGMQVRNELMDYGIAAENIQVIVRESQLPEEENVVRVFLKP
ncbi:MAG: hypothetical protein AAF619_10510 [Pseudomonadota bacterium]